jgi:WD40 repeat protein
MLRPEQLAHLGIFLRQHGHVVSPAQLLDAANLLAKMQALPQGAQALSPWLSPLFCSNGREQAQFSELYQLWLQESGLDNGASPPRGTDEPRAQRPLFTAPPGASAQADKGWRFFIKITKQRTLAAWALTTRKWLDWLAAGLLLAVLVGALWGISWAWDNWHERALTVRVMGDQAKGDPALLAHAEVSIQEQRSGRTDQNGELRLVFKRVDLPLDVMATHPSRQTPSGKALTSAVRLDEPPVEPIELKFSTPIAPPPSQMSQVAQPLATLPPPPDVQGPASVSQRSATDPTRLTWILLSGLAPLLGGLIEHLRRRGFLERLPADKDVSARSFKAASTHALSALKSDLRQMGRELRRRVVVASRELDVIATLAATLKRGGVPQFVHGSRVEPEHLVLVDRASHGDHQARLADELVRDLHHQGLIIERYVFDASLRRCWHAPLEGQPFQRGPLTLAVLSNRHPGARLLVFSDGRELIDPLLGIPVPEVAQLQAWERPLLITPATQTQWGQREALLQRGGLTVLPLDSEGMELIAEALTSMRPSAPSRLQAMRHRALYQQDVDMLLDVHAPPEPFIAKLMDALCVDLAQDDESSPPRKGQADSVCFAWLCAVAIYPEVHWGITLLVGETVTRVLAPDEADDERLRAARLTRLARLPWLRHNRMPDWLREALLARLPEATDKALRQSLAAFLDEIASQERHAGARPEVDALQIAKDPRDQAPWRDCWRGLTRLLTSRPQPPASGDMVFLRFMDGRQRHTTRLSVTDRLRRLLYRGGVPLAGPRMVVPLLFAALCTGSTWMWVPQHKVPVNVPGPIIPTYPEVIALDAKGQELAAIDNAGGIVRTTMSTRAWQTLKAGASTTSGGFMPPVAGRAALLALPAGGWVAGETTPNTAPRLRAWSADGQAIEPAHSWRLTIATRWESARPEGQRSNLSAPGRASGLNPAGREEPGLTHEAALCTVADAIRKELVILTASFLQRTLFKNGNTALGCAVSAGGQQLAVQGSDGSVYLLPLGEQAGAGEAAVRSLLAERQPVPALKLEQPSLAMAIDDPGSTLAVVQGNGVLMLYQGAARTASVVATLPSGSVVALSGDGKVMATTLGDGSTQIWRVTPELSRQVLISVEGVSDDVIDKGKTGAVSVRPGVDALATVLNQRYGFEAVRLRQPSRAALLQVLDRTLASLGPKDRMVLHISGSASQGAPSGSANVTLDNRGEQLQLSELADRLRASMVKEVLVLLDTPMNGDGATILGKATKQATVAGRGRALVSELGSIGLESDPGLFSHALAVALGQAKAPLNAKALTQAALKRLPVSDIEVIVNMPDAVAWPAAGDEGGDVSLTPLQDRPLVKVPPLRNSRTPASSTDAGIAPSSGSSPTSASVVLNQAPENWVEAGSVDFGDPVMAVSFSREGRLAAGISKNDTIKIWDLAANRQLGRPIPSGKWTLAFSQTRDVLYFGQLDKVMAFDIQRNAQVQAWTGEGGIVDWIAPSNDDRLLAVASRGKYLTVLNTQNASSAGLTSAAIAGTSDSRSAFMPDGRRVVLLTDDGVLALLDAAFGKLLAQTKAHSVNAQGLSISPDGQTIATCAYDGKIKLWRGADLAPLRTMDTESGCRTVSFDPNGRQLLSAGISGFTDLIDIDSGAHAATLPRVAKSWINHAIFSPDGRRIALASDDGRMYFLQRPPTKVNSSP